MRSTPLHKAALFEHPDYCQSERTFETLQLFLLRHEVNHLEMDVSRDLLDTAVGVNGFFGLGQMPANSNSQNCTFWTFRVVPENSTTVYTFVK